MGEHGILKVDDADTRQSFALRQPDEIRRMVVAKDPAALAGNRLFEERPEALRKRRTGGGREIQAADMRRVPVEQQFRLDLIASRS